MGDIFDKIRESPDKKKKRFKEYSNNILFEGKTMYDFNKQNLYDEAKLFALNKNLEFINTKLKKKNEKKKDNYNVFNIENEEEFSYFYDDNTYMTSLPSNTIITNFNSISSMLKNKIENSIQIIKQIFGKKMKTEIGYNSIFPDREKEANEIVNKYTKENIISKKYDMLDGINYCGHFCFFVLILCIYVISFIYYNSQKSWYKEEYFALNEFDGNKLVNIRKNFDVMKNEQIFMNDFSLSFYKFAGLAYKEYEKIYPSKKYMNWDIINYGNLKKDNYFYTLKEDKTKNIIITFPGTKGILQLLEEVLGSYFIKLDKTENILISRYFGERAQSLLHLIFNEEMINLLNNGYQITSTGHSLGGALAQAFMYFAISQKFVKKENNPATITFNQPKVGNELFAQFLRKNSLNIRFTHGKDIVSSIPFFDFGFFNFFNYFFKRNELFNKYVHTGAQIDIVTINYNLPNWLFIIFIFIGIGSFVFFIIYYWLLYYKILDYVRCYLKNFFSRMEKYIVISIILYVIMLIIIVCYIGKLIIKYKTYKFILILIILYILFFFVYLILFIYFIFCLHELGIFCINIYYTLRNLFITEKKTIEIKKEEFKKAEPKEQCKIIGSFLFMSIGGPILGEVYSQTVVSHSTTMQRRGNEQFVLKEENLPNLLDDIDGSKTVKEIGFKLIDKIDLSNEQIFKTY